MLKNLHHFFLLNQTGVAIRANSDFRENICRLQSIFSGTFFHAKGSVDNDMINEIIVLVYNL